MNYITKFSKENFEKYEPLISSVTYGAIGIFSAASPTIEWIKGPLTVDGFIFYSGANAVTSGLALATTYYFKRVKQYEVLYTVALFALNATCFSFYYSNTFAAPLDILRLTLFPLVIKTVFFGIHSLGLKTLKNIWLPNGSIVDTLNTAQEVTNLSEEEYNICKTELKAAPEKWRGWSDSMQIAFNQKEKNSDFIAFTNLPNGSIVDKLHTAQEVTNLSEEDHNTCKTELRAAPEKWRSWSTSMQIAFNQKEKNSDFISFTNLTEKNTFKTEELTTIKKVNKGTDSLEYLKFLFDQNRSPNKKPLQKRKFSFLEIDDSFDPNTLKANQLIWYFHYFNTHPSKWEKLPFHKQIIFKTKFDAFASKSRNYRTRTLDYFPHKENDLQSLQPEIEVALHGQYSIKLKQWILLPLSVQIELNKLFVKHLKQSLPIPDTKQNIQAFDSELLAVYTKAFNGGKLFMYRFTLDFLTSFELAYDKNSNVPKPRWLTG